MLKFLNLLDYEGNFSISNFAVYIALIKIILMPGSSLEDAGILFTVLANYSYKKHLISKNQDVEKNYEAKLQEVEDKISKQQSIVTSLQIQSGMKVK